MTFSIYPAPIGNQKIQSKNMWECKKRERERPTVELIMLCYTSGSRICLRKKFKMKTVYNQQKSWELSQVILTDNSFFFFLFFKWATAEEIKLNSREEEKGKIKREVHSTYSSCCANPTGSCPDMEVEYMHILKKKQKKTHTHAHNHTCLPISQCWENHSSHDTERLQVR